MWGVYALPGADRRNWKVRALAGCLAVGDDAIVSHETAGAIWEMREATPGAPSILVSSGSRSRVHGVVVRTSRILKSSEIVIRGPFRITSPKRTLLDLASSADIESLERALDCSVVHRLVELRDLIEYLDAPRYSKYSRVHVLRRLASDRLTGVPESELERELDRLYRRFGLPAGVRQFVVSLGSKTYRLDRCHPESQLAVEVDGFATHRTREDFQSDRERKNGLELAGWHLLTFTWADVTERPDFVALTIARGLRLTPRSWRSARKP